MENGLIIVSNRLPFTIKKVNDSFEVVPSTGGLVTAIRSMENKNSITWIGAADFSEEDWQAYNPADKQQEINIEPLFLDKKTEELYYNGFSNSLLWPLFHYFPTFAVYDEEHYKAYKTVNELFSQKIIATAKPNDLVWIHDYHLMLVPGLLREGETKINSSFFLHIPFPSFELIKSIPEEWRNNILKSLIQANVVGFHTKEYCNHFKSALSFFLGIESSGEYINSDGHVALIRDYPISIDFTKFNSAYDEEAITNQRKLIRQKYKDAKVIFSLDRLDYSKGVMNRLQAFEALLEKQPDLHEKVVFVINVIPSREAIPQYLERKRLIEENISRINGLYSTLAWQPIVYQYRHLNMTQLLACYTGCDCILVTPLRDGMNLVAKEFVASRKDQQGVLVLSELAGAANELTGAILVNPNDIQLMQDAMLQAIFLPEDEQRMRMQKMQEVIQKNDVNKWMNSFLNDALSGSNRGQQGGNMMSYYDRVQIGRAYQSASRRLILLDYDGTLIPFHNKPEEAVPGELIKQLVNKLKTDDRNTVMIISGRDAETLDSWFKETDIGIVAEHGSMFKKPGSTEWESPSDLNLNWKEQVKKFLQSQIDAIPGSFIEEKKYALAWHYRAVENLDEEAVRLNFSKELMLLNFQNDFDILHGNKVIEIKSSFSNKGKFVTDFLSKEKYEFVLAIGDDATDEDMFNFLTSDYHFTIKVGHGKTSAKYSMLGVNNVISFLNTLSQIKTDNVVENPLRF